MDDDTVEGVKRITRGASTRIARTAFEYAVRNGRSKVTAAHKANVCKQADGLFLEACRAVAEEFPSMTYEEQVSLSESELSSERGVIFRLTALVCFASPDFF